MNRRSGVVLAALALLAGACASTSTFPPDGGLLRNAQDTPMQFVTEAGVAGAPDTCVSPLIDPRDQTRVALVRSGSVRGARRGDYAVPGDRYGVTSGALLRIDCGTGRALGIVAK